MIKGIKESTVIPKKAALLKIRSCLNNFYNNKLGCLALVNYWEVVLNNMTFFYDLKIMSKKF